MKILKKISLFISILLISFPSISQNTTNVLFVGNSFTAANGLSQLFLGIAASEGFPVYVADRVPGGASVGDTVHSSIVHMYDTALYNLIRSRSWDYLVIQDNQGAYVNSYGVFNPIYNVFAGHKRIRDSLLAVNPCANMVLFAGWALQGGYPPYGINAIQMIQRIFANYCFLNDSVQQIVAPIGPAWIRSLNNFPAINLWGPDSTHPSLEGSYLTACVIFATIFRKDPANSPFTGGVNPSDAVNLNNLAFAAVTDSLTQCNLDSFTPSLILNIDTLVTDTGYVTYKWYKGIGGLYQTTSLNYLKINVPAIYYVECIDANGCTRMSFELNVTSTGIKNTPAIFEISVYPNPVSDILYLKFKGELPKNVDIEISDIQGKILVEKTLSYSEKEIDISAINHGIYILKCISDKAVIIRKFVKQ